MLKSSNIRECVGIARLAKNDSAQVNRIIDTFSKYGGMTEKCRFIHSPIGREQELNVYLQINELTLS
jgi:hypothetical protein